MHVYQPISRDPQTGLLIVWFALRPDLAPPGQIQPREFSEFLTKTLSEDDERRDSACRFISQCMTESEMAALASFISRNTTFVPPAGRTISLPLRMRVVGEIWDDLSDNVSINLDAHPGYDLPWDVRGRVIELAAGGAR